MVSNELKELYNTYLVASRSSRNQPFRIRKNFDGFEDTIEYSYLKRIQRFLYQYPQIKTRLYFEAPYKIYEDTDYFDLKYFTTQKAVYAYTTYMKQLQEESPDSDHHIQFIKDSLRFIGMFCIKNNISLDDYITHSGGATYSWMKHLREHNVSIYALFEYPMLFDIIRSTPRDELDLLLGSINLNIPVYKGRYMSSRNARRIVKEGFKRIKRVIDESVDKE